ncbi:GIY-YIG nuclease family protein [Methylobacterium sp. CM6247]
MASAEPAFLYVIGSREDGPHKVGLSVDPGRRLKGLQTGNPRRLVVKRAAPSPTNDASAVERYAHYLLRESAILGEWFNVTEEAAWVALVAATEAVANGLSAPGRPGFGGAGRPMLWPDKIVAPLPKGSLARMEAVLQPAEDKTDFLRTAVEAELKRRERKPKTGPGE